MFDKFMIKIIVRHIPAHITPTETFAEYMEVYYQDDHGNRIHDTTWNFPMDRLEECKGFVNGMVAAMRIAKNLIGITLNSDDIFLNKLTVPPE